MIDLTNPAINEYASQHTSDEPTLLTTINRDTQLNVLKPRMISGHHQGRFLAMLSHMIQPTNVLEIGTYTGYSALCFLEGLKEGGIIDTIDINEELEERVRASFKEAQVEERINYILGNALDIIPALNKTYDLVFIDADKENYQHYYELVFPKLAVGAHVVIDNVLWSGKVLGEESGKKIDKDTQAIIDFNKFVQQDSRVENVLVTLRDGLMIARKIND